MESPSKNRKILHDANVCGRTFIVSSDYPTRLEWGPFDELDFIVFERPIKELIPQSAYPALIIIDERNDAYRLSGLTDGPAMFELRLIRRGAVGSGNMPVRKAREFFLSPDGAKMVFGPNEAEFWLRENAMRKGTKRPSKVDKSPAMGRPRAYFDD